VTSSGLDPLLAAALFLAGLVVGVQQAIRHSADATLHDGHERAWWRKAQYRARQRAEYKEFVQSVERERAQARQRQAEGMVQDGD